MSSAFRFDRAVIDMGSAVKKPPAPFEIELTSSVVLRRQPPPVANVQPRRAKIWELAGHLHCSIVGTCLTTAELRSVLAKLGLATASDSDHDLHGQAVSLAGRHDAAAKLLNKALDQRHRLALNQFDPAKTEAAIGGLWQAARQRGDIPGAYWALLTHPQSGRELIRQAFGDVHMLSHLVGAANRADIRRLSQLEAERAELTETLQRQQLQLREAVVSGEAKIRDLNSLLARKIGAERDAAAAGPDDEAIMTRLVADLERRLESESRRRGALELRMERSLTEAAEERALRMAAESREEILRQELSAMEGTLAVDDPAPGPPAAKPASLDGIALLYVGGRPKQVGHARTLAEHRGATFLHHDGGIEDNGALLAGLVSRCDVAAFPVDCISHDAALMVKRLCRQSAKPFLPLRTSGAGSLVAALDRPEIDDLRGRRRAGAAPNPQAASATSSCAAAGSGRVELQRHAVHAIAQARRRRTVVEDMAEMPTAARATDLGALHEQRRIGRGYDGTVQRLPETGPTGAAFELRGRGIQRQVAGRTGECPGAMLVEERTRAGGLGSSLAQDVVLLRRQKLAPFIVGVGDREHFGRGGPVAHPEITVSHGDPGQPNRAHQHLASCQLH
jgi:hypothetical protein